MNKQLLTERNNSKKKKLDISDKNIVLKSDMAEFLVQFMELQQQRDQLQLAVDRFDQNSSAFEEALAYLH